MVSMYMAAQNLISGRVQHDLRHPLDKAVRADGKFPYRPDIVSTACLHHSSRSRAFSSYIVLSLSGLPQAGEAVRGPDRVKSDGRRCSQDGCGQMQTKSEVGIGCVRIKSCSPLRTHG